MMFSYLLLSKHKIAITPTQPASGCGVLWALRWWLFTSFLQDLPFLTEEERKDLETIHSQAKGFEVVVSNLLTCSKEILHKSTDLLMSNRGALVV